MLRAKLGGLHRTKCLGAYAALARPSIKHLPLPKLPRKVCPRDWQKFTSLGLPRFANLLQASTSDIHGNRDKRAWPEGLIGIWENSSEENGASGGVNGVVNKIELSFRNDTGACFRASHDPDDGCLVTDG